MEDRLLTDREAGYAGRQSRDLVEDELDHLDELNITGKESAGLYKEVQQEEGQPKAGRGYMVGPEGRRKRHLIWLALGAVCLVGLGALYWFVPASLLFATAETDDVNVILMISDGFGPASETFARHLVQGTSSSPYNTTLPLDALLVGSSRTRSSDSLITDSAAGATAFACGLKTYNGAIGVEPNGVEPCGTVLESAHLSGYLTGLVATSRITHATPASFAAHVPDRDMEDEIALWLAGEGGAGALGRTLDLGFGGGRCHFLDKSVQGSCRRDKQDVVALARKNGFQVIFNRSEYDTIEETGGSLPLLGLFNADHMNYELDRSSSDEPSLEHMSIKALNLLDKAVQQRGKKGFFIMIEGSRIDMAGHSNDPAGHLHDIFAYNAAIQAVKNWIDAKSTKRTLLISVSDHETGGMALGRQLHTTYPEYQYYPNIVMNATRTSDFLARRLLTHPGLPNDPTDAYLHSEILAPYGIVDADSKEVQSLHRNWQNAYHIDATLADMLSRRAQIGWSTHGHSGIDVNLYAHGYQSELLAGNHDNTEIGQVIAQVMRLDLKEPTEMLRATKGQWWKDSTRGKNKGLLPGLDTARIHLNHYRGDHRL